MTAHQLTLLDGPGPRPVADVDGVELPVARVAVDVPLPHLDRPFDYRVPASMDAAAVPGARVFVRFAGTDRPGFILERAATTDHAGALTPIRRVVSPVAVLTPAVLGLCRAVADRYAGTLMDVVRLAVPPRHASTENAVLEKAGEDRTGLTQVWTPGPAWAPYVGGPAFVNRLAQGQSPRAVWTALPDAAGPPWIDAVAEAAAATLASGRGVLVVVPDSRDVAAVAAGLGAALPDEPVRQLLAEDGPGRRYRSFLTLLLGRARVVVGTRSAAFAPVRDLGLVVCWDDGDDALAEPRAPYPHARQVLTLRAEREDAALLLGSFSRSVEAELLVAEGWARPVQAARATVRTHAPRVEAPGALDLAREGPAAHARIPHPAWRLVRDALGTGPVLVQVPRAGYVPVVACERCREPARCRHCGGPMGLASARSAPSCRWCARPDAGWTCPHCQATALRARRVGSGRTAEELGRAFPAVPVLVSGARADHGVVGDVDGRPRLVIATPGAEPRAEGGYTAALLLDAAASTARPELWASVEALRRWTAAAALVRPAADGGRVLLLGDPAPGPAQALVRWDPAGFAARELAERTELHLPPAVRMAAVDGEPAAVAAYLRHLTLPPGGEVLGPVPLAEGRSRALVRIERHRGGELTRELAAASALRSAHKEPDAVTVRVDPTDLW
ncbi:primosomal protein N' [Georgenia faecalis]|uniref:Probable replication restart protein PriA n=1 Tax=Georgenia faecalis TaxID=2483799 RepID=A0ABV9D8Q1_9MICO|nr:primosomal protein N' [Georgenia faecalis]